MTVNIHEAKTNLSKLIAYVEKGEDIVIAKAGNPIARLVSYVSAKKNRTPNLLKGGIHIYGDFDAPNDEIADLFGDKN